MRVGDLHSINPRVVPGYPFNSVKLHLAVLDGGRWRTACTPHQRITRLRSEQYACPLMHVECDACRGSNTFIAAIVAADRAQHDAVLAEMSERIAALRQPPVQPKTETLVLT